MASGCDLCGAGFGSWRVCSGFAPDSDCGVWPVCCYRSGLAGDDSVDQRPGGLIFVARRNLGVVFGMVFLCHQTGAFLGAWGGGWWRDWYGGYESFWLVAALLGHFGQFAACLHSPRTGLTASRAHPCPSNWLSRDGNSHSGRRCIRWPVGGLAGDGGDAQDIGAAAFAEGHPGGDNRRITNFHHVFL